MADNLTIYNGPLGSYTAATTDLGSGVHAQKLIAGSPFIPVNTDYISCSYTGNDLTGVVCKSGGASGTVIATLTLTYSSGILQTVTRT